MRPLFIYCNGTELRPIHLLNWNKINPLFIYLFITIKQGHRQMMFKNKILRGVFGPTKNEAIGEWRKWHNEELHI
jgi:hypothetical protein